ncbi:MAG: S-layer homology domain-containing protein [Bacillota bacterium]
MNKKLIMLLTLVMVMTLTVPVMAGQFNDVPQNHWAYSSLEKVAQAGLLSGFADGSFKGKQELSRYQVAALTSRVMDKIETGDTQINADVAQAIESLAQEFDAELVELNSKIKDLETVQITGESGLYYKDVEVTGDGESYIDPYEQDIDGDDDIDDDDKILAEDYLKQTATFNVGIVKDDIEADVQLDTIGNYYGDTNEAADDQTVSKLELDTISARVKTEDFTAKLGEEQVLGWKDYLFYDNEDNADDENISGVVLEAGNSVVGFGQYLNDSDEEMRNIAAKQNNIFSLPINAYLGVAENKDTEDETMVVGLDAAYQLAGVDLTGEVAVNAGDNDGKLLIVGANKAVDKVNFGAEYEVQDQFVAIQPEADYVGINDQDEVTVKAEVTEDNPYQILGTAVFGEYEYQLESEDEVRYIEANKELGDFTAAAIYDYDTAENDNDKVVSVAYAPQFKVRGLELMPQAKIAAVYDQDNEQSTNKEAKLDAKYQVNKKLAVIGGYGWADKEDYVDIAGEKTTANAGVEYQVTEDSTASINYQKMDFNAVEDTDSFDRQGISGNMNFKF